MKNFLVRLTSRKFLLAVASFCTFMANKQYTEAMGVVVAYVAAEGFSDTAQRYQAEKTKQAEKVLEDTKIQFGELGGAAGGVDRGSLVPGSEVPSE